jgi:hypothetical protein
MGRLERNARTYRHDQGIWLSHINQIENWRKKKKTVEIGIDYGHQKAKDYLTQELKQLLNNKKKDSIQTFLQGLTSTESTDYSL